MGRQEKERIQTVAAENLHSRLTLVMTMDAIRASEKSAHIPLLEKEFRLLAETCARTEWGEDATIDWDKREVRKGKARVQPF